MITNEEADILVEKYPFLNAVKYRDQWIVGIIQNVETQFVWLYDLSLIKEPMLKRAFLDYGYDWYTQSDMEIPIDMFMQGQFDIFKEYLRGYNKRQIGDNIKGHQVNLEMTFEKRIKKKKIEIKVESE